MQRPDGGQKRRQITAQVVVRCMVCLASNGEICLCSSELTSISVGKFGLLHAGVNPALVSFEVELFILSLLNDFSSYLKVVPCLLRRVYHFVLDIVELFNQVLLQVLVFTFQPTGTSYQFLRGFDGYMTNVVLTGTNYWCIE